MAEIVNLRQARKRAARAEKERRAEENRTLHALPKRQRKQAAEETEQRLRRLDAHRLDGSAGGSDDDGDDRR